MCILYKTGWVEQLVLSLNMVMGEYVVLTSPFNFVYHVWMLETGSKMKFFSYFVQKCVYVLSGSKKNKKLQSPIASA